MGIRLIRKNEGIEIEKGPRKGELRYTPAAKAVAKKIGADLLDAILAVASCEAWDEADRYRWRYEVDIHHGPTWNTAREIDLWLQYFAERVAKGNISFDGDSGVEYTAADAKPAFDAIMALSDDDRYSLIHNSEPPYYSDIEVVVSDALDLAPDDDDDDDDDNENERRTHISEERTEAAHDLEAIRAKFCDNPERAKIGRLAEPFEGDAVFGTQTWSDGVPVTKYWHRDNRSRWVSLKKGTRCIVLLDSDFGEEVVDVWIPYRNGWLRADGNDIKVDFN